MFKSLFFTVLFLVVMGEVKAAPHPDYRIIENFSNRWLSYSQDEEVYLPYTFNSEQAFQTFSIAVDFLQYPHAYLVLKTPNAESSIFINHSLYKVTTKSEWLIYSLDKLKKDTKKDTVYLSIFAKARPSEVVAYIGFPAKSTSKGSLAKEQPRDVVKLLPRLVSNINSSVALAFVMILIISSFVSNNYARAYYKYYSLKEVLSVKVKDDLFLIGKALDRTNLFFVILLSGITALFILVLLVGGWKISGSDFFNFSGNNQRLQIFNFFKLWGSVFIIYILKFIFISLIATLFNLKKIVDQYYYKLIQFTIFFISVAVLLLLIMYSLYLPLPENIGKILLIIFSIFLVFRTLLIFFTINKDSQVNFLYMFSYLCIAEILPVVIGIGFLS